MKVWGEFKNRIEAVEGAASAREMNRSCSEPLRVRFGHGESQRGRHLEPVFSAIGCTRLLGPFLFQAPKGSVCQIKILVEYGHMKTLP